MTRQVAGMLVAIMLTSAVAPAEAGCLKGAMIGALAGHFMHHHAVLGAISGCAVGHHMAVKAHDQKAAQAKATAAAAPHHP
jgi:hypothetical protein